MAAKIEQYDFSAYKRAVNMEEMMKEVNSARSGNREDVPYDVYDVKIVSIQIRPKKDDPSKLNMSVSMQIQAGEFKGRYLNAYFSMMNASGITSGENFLKSLEIVDDGDCLFKGDIDEYSKRVIRIGELCAEDEGHYKLDYHTNEKGTWRIFDISPID